MINIKLAFVIVTSNKFPIRYSFNKLKKSHVKPCCMLVIIHIIHDRLKHLFWLIQINICISYYTLTFSIDFTESS